MRGVRVITGLTGLFLFVASSARGQASAREEFEVAAVKPFTPNPDGTWSVRTEGGPGTSDPSRIRYVNPTLKILLATAYGVGYSVISGPAWLDSERCIIEATIRPGSTKEQVNQMLQNLLLDRFKMTLHRETRRVPLYELTVVKKGPKLVEFVENAPGPADGKLSATEKDGFVRIRPGPLPLMFEARGISHAWGAGETVAELVNYLSSVLKAPVVDMTGLTGKYDYNLEYSGSPLNATTDNIADPAPDFVTAVKDQLGLKLESKKGTIDLLVIDHIEKNPTPN
jgi:uncharacterized protein (TIGR03435 family)